MYFIYIYLYTYIYIYIKYVIGSRVYAFCLSVIKEWPSPATIFIYIGDQSVCLLVLAIWTEEIIMGKLKYLHISRTRNVYEKSVESLAARSHSTAKFFARETTSALCILPWRSFKRFK